MNFTVQPMDRDGALEISRWTYDTPYDLYNMDNSNEGISELLNGTYFKILDERDLIGYCCFGDSAKVPIGTQYGAYPENGTIDFGLGMRPDLTGHGRGRTFVNTILEFAQSEFQAKLFRLTVAEFNDRVITVY
ncbi:GNAT family N-acetyltransferase [Alicyclobacillus fastidiosus]|uniref:GNAT family N-acetyltransferase n=1 Tax=Alicyclobacillus fastidiosus TaxID=392011 RepID=A0ABY6ZPR2_9BACL|nr:GNAT family N-acetyltransferase [Alicyclobacillus fastidiosus]WAH44437.1 GNAT family N-acetyltransferase [Alicyclobacillus fastidiosus]GMA60781.1 N-acetyltransferase [Alicyclobacillus fastidiosus]